MIPALGLILAGGRGSRMGGADKGFVSWRGEPLVEQVLRALRPQVAQVAISANRNLARYAELGVPVWADEAPFEGPLAGLHAGLRQLADGLDWLWLVPVDSPELPPNLGAALMQQVGTAPAVLPRTPDGQLHPTHALVHRRLQPALASLLAEPGERGAARWLLGQGATAFDWPQDLPGFNQPADLAR
ncbi:molybdenum cofactor guanylyltransferase MobA [Inhella sp.]|uniref:molybdenum cofactor guanylyltransferase MobA n=1 Tax=Inhella sp. TaxID=1921806 RepID=UPI0035AFD906